MLVDKNGKEITAGCKVLFDDTLCDIDWVGESHRKEVQELCAKHMEVVDIDTEGECNLILECKRTIQPSPIKEWLNISPLAPEGEWKVEKTETMKRYESDTGKQSAILKFMVGGQALEQKSYPKIGPYDYSTEYIALLEAKATAYDRLMTNGLLMKELANILKHPVAIENDEGQDTLYYFGSTPRIGQFSDGTQFWSCCGGVRTLKWRLPRQLVIFTGDWKDSLTLPDGWETKGENK